MENAYTVMLLRCVRHISPRDLGNNFITCFAPRLACTHSHVLVFHRPLCCFKHFSILVIRLSFADLGFETCRIRPSLGMNFAA